MIDSESLTITHFLGIDKVVDIIQILIIYWSLGQ